MSKGIASSKDTVFCLHSSSQPSLQHALECKKGGKVILRHNELRDETADLAAKAFIPSAIRNEPLNYTSCPAVKMPALDPHPSVTLNMHKNRSADRGDLSICGLWQRQTDCIIDVRVTDTDAKSNLSKDPAKVLEAHEKGKKRKYLAPCIAQRRHFTPFAVSTDGLIGKEAKSVLKALSIKLAEKWEKPYTVVRGYVNTRMSIAISHCPSHSHLPARLPHSLE
jgi:hypothetical protein